MSQYLSPGVYVEEKSSGVKPIEGVGTSTGAFVGIAEKGPIGKAELIANWTQFVNKFGGYITDGFLAYVVNQFFSEGGTSCYVVRTCHYEDITKTTTKTSVFSAGTLLDSDNNPSIGVMASSDGKWGDKISVEVKAATDEPEGFMLVVKYDGEIVEFFDNLTIANVEDIVNYKEFAHINVEKDDWKDGDPPTEKTGSGNIPKLDESITLAGGDDGIAKKDGTMSLQPADFLGDPSARNGIHGFDEVDNINIVAIPDMAGDRDVILGGLNYCQNRADCFYIADPAKELTPTEVADFKKGTGDYQGNAFNSSYGALYYPWIYFNDPLTGKKKLLPPSGVVAGTYAYTDSVRGVHKAAAGISEGKLDSVTGIERIIIKSEHDLLNPLGINVIRSFPLSGICLWGARTLSADAEWKYINVRRLFLFLEESIDKGTQWVVFEPNTPALWGSVKRNITAFLLRVWRDGALFGNTAEEAFFVRVDEENNPPEVRDAGQLIIEVGVAPVKPAEFVIIRISQKTLSK
jgi:phage tail sheath protein FI